MTDVKSQPGVSDETEIDASSENRKGADTGTNGEEIQLHVDGQTQNQDVSRESADGDYTSAIFHEVETNEEDQLKPVLRHGMTKSFHVDHSELEKLEVSDEELSKTKEAELNNRNPEQTCRCCAASNCCIHFERMSFLDVIRKSQSGDIILFDNPVQCNTCFISCMTRSDWDHVGIVVKKPGGSLSETYLLEALAPKVLRDKLYSVLHWVDDPNDTGKATHPGITFWRPLAHPGEKTVDHPYGVIDPAMEKKIWDLANANMNKNYERNPVEMIEGAIAMDNQCWSYFCGNKCCDCAEKKYDKTEGGEKDTSLDSVFCSELVAHCYMSIGILRKEIKAHMYLPKDFSSDPHNRVQDYIKEGYELKKEVMLIRNDDLSAFYEYIPGSTYKDEDAMARKREVTDLLKTAKTVKECAAALKDAAHYTDLDDEIAQCKKNLENAKQASRSDPR
jgi:hypothetical protein